MKPLPAAWLLVGLLAVGALALGALAVGCAAPRGAHRKAGGSTLHTVKGKPTPARVHRRHWRDELARYHSIPQLWNAINRYQDALGYALHPGYPSTPVVVPYRRWRPRPRAGGSPPDRPAPPRIDRPPVGARGRAPLCRRACNHVRAICYAARRICRIANRLRETRALIICKRATARCADARRTARRRCNACD